VGITPLTHLALAGQVAAEPVHAVAGPALSGVVTGLRWWDVYVSAVRLGDVVVSVTLCVGVGGGVYVTVCVEVTVYGAVGRDLGEDPFDAGARREDRKRSEYHEGPAQNVAARSHAPPNALHEANIS